MKFDITDITYRRFKSNQIENSLINSLSEKLLGFKLYHQLTFDKYVKSLCKKAYAKLETFTSVVRYMGSAKKNLKNDFFFRYAMELFIVNMDDS